MTNGSREPVAGGRVAAVREARTAAAVAFRAARLPAPGSRLPCVS
jgi:hypothetical protein